MLQYLEPFLRLDLGKNLARTLHLTLFQIWEECALIWVWRSNRPKSISTSKATHLLCALHKSISAIFQFIFGKKDRVLLPLRRIDLVSFEKGFCYLTKLV